MVDASTSPVQVNVLIDALGWEIAQQYDFLADVLPHRKRLKTVLGFSCAAIPSILTGKAIQQHGKWNLFYYDPRRSPFKILKYLDVLPDAVISGRVVRKLTKLYMKKVRSFKGYLELYDIPVRSLQYIAISETADIYQPRGIEGVTSLFDILEKERVQYRSYTYKECSDREIFTRLKEDVERRSYDYYFVYLCEVDRLLHTHINGSEVAPAVKWYEAQLKNIIDLLPKEAQVNIFSDHGMTPFKGQIDIQSVIDPLDLKQPKDYFAFYDATMARFWTHSDTARDTLLSALSKIPHAHLLSFEELLRYRVAFADFRYGDIVLLADPGYQIVPSYMASRPLAGMHGYAPEDADSCAAVISNQNVDDIHEITDLFTLLLPKSAA